MSTTQLFCLQHCANSNIFYLNFPDKCPICGEDLQRTSLKIPPFCLPVPLSSAKNSPLSLVLKPTTGTFLQDYKLGDDLHVGITNSRGNVYEYDYDGLKIVRGNVTWDGCIIVSLNDTVVADNDSVDRCLNDTELDESWTAAKYNEMQHNCFTYVLQVLNRINPQTKWEKVSLCQEIILPALRKSMKYFQLYRKVFKDSVYVQTLTK